MLSRREFIGNSISTMAMVNAARLTFGANLLTLAAKTSYEIAAYIPPSNKEKTVSYPNPGWFESNHPKRPELLNPNVGPQYYLNYLAREDQFLRNHLLKPFYDNFLYSKANKLPQRLGDAFEIQIANARHALLKSFPDFGEPKISDILHIAIISSAICYSQYLPFWEIKKITPNSYPDSRNIYDLPDIDKRTPNIYPSKTADCQPPLDSKPVCNGHHRTMHVFVHAFLVHQYIYSSNNGLFDHERIPLGIKAVLNVSSQKIIDRARILSDWTGKIFEGIETGYDLRKWLQTGEIEQTGFDHRMVLASIAANKLGASLGAITSQQNPTESDINFTLQVLNDQKIYQEFTAR